MKLVRIAAFALAALMAGPSLASDGPKWSDWNDELFTRAAAEKRFVILDLEAVWCHWCHVMEKTTYANPEVQELLASKYLPVRVDQDANPDLANRYGDWGWPATIVFGPDGTEIAKIRGYIEPERMQDLLKAIIDDPSPGPSVGEAFEVKPSASAFLSKQARAELTKHYDESWDDKLGGWGESLKFIDADSMDLAITRAEAGDATASKRARQTLDAAIALIDPVWGGVFQYSETGSWTHPHFEKIMSFQAQYLRQYSQAYALWKDPKYLAAAQNIERYLATFLTSPEGAFYVSQDADLDHDTDGLPLSSVWNCASQTCRLITAIERGETSLASSRAYARTASGSRAAGNTWLTSPMRERLLRAERAPEIQEVEAVLQAHQAGQHPAHPVLGDEAAPRERGGEHRGVGGHAQVAVERDHQAEAGGGAVDRRDDRLRIVGK